jgi:predicted metal-binding protein
VNIVFAKEISTVDIAVSPRPVWKCRTCPNYGRTPSCPPHVPSWQEARLWIDHFQRALFIKYRIGGRDYREEKRKALRHLLEKEREYFEDNRLYACALFPGECNLCDGCAFAAGSKCVHPDMVRPSVDALGIEITSLADINFHESVLYGVVLID